MEMGSRPDVFVFSRKMHPVFPITTKRQSHEGKASSNRYVRESYKSNEAVNADDSMSRDDSMSFRQHLDFVTCYVIVL